MRKIGGKSLGKITDGIVDERYLVIDTRVIQVICRRIQLQDDRSRIALRRHIASQGIRHCIALMVCRRTAVDEIGRVNPVDRLVEIAQIEHWTQAIGFVVEQNYGIRGKRLRAHRHDR